MSSQVPKHAGETLPDHTQAFGRGETVMADLVAPNDVRWRGSALTPHAFAPGEELGYLVRHRIFACLPENAGYGESRRREPTRRSR